MKYTFKRLVALTALIGTITTHSYGMNNDTQNEGAAAAAPRTASSITRTGSVEYTRIDEHTVRCTLIPKGRCGEPVYFNPSYDPSILTPNVRRLEVDVIENDYLTPQALWQGLLHILTPLEGEPIVLPSVQEIVFAFSATSEGKQIYTSLLESIGELLPNLRFIGNSRCNCFSIDLLPALNLKEIFPNLKTLELLGCEEARVTANSANLNEWENRNPDVDFTLVRSLNTSADLRLLEDGHLGGRVTYGTYDFHKILYPNLASRFSLRFNVDPYFININPDGTFDFSSRINRGYTQRPNTLTSLQQLVESTYIPDLRRAFWDGRRVNLRSLPKSHRQAIFDYLNANRAELDAEIRPIMEKDPWVCTLGTEERRLRQAIQWFYEDFEIEKDEDGNYIFPLLDLMLRRVLSEDTNLRVRIAGENYYGFPVDLDSVQNVSFYDALRYLLLRQR